MNNELPECKFDYENVKVKCPYCGELNIFNRASDLNTLKWIGSCNKPCMFCGQNIPLNGDFINPAYQMMFYKTYQHKEVKEYMQSIITICTSYEMFFMFVLRLFLTVKPLKNITSPHDLIQTNKKLNEQLEQKIRRYTFTKMLNEFAKILVQYDLKPIETVESSKKYITKMDGKQVNIESIKQIKNIDLRNQLIVLCKLKEKELLIDNIRNKVVHKQGYRPTLEEVEREIKIACNIIFKLTNILYLITDDVIIYYRMNRD